MGLIERNKLGDDPHPRGVYAPDAKRQPDPFFTEVNNELADKGFWSPRRTS
jgi:hypothetical protein